MKTLKRNPLASLSLAAVPVVASLTGALVGHFSAAWIALAVPALAASLWALSSTRRTLLVAVATAILLPFGVIPVRLVATPSLLEILLAAAVLGWFLSSIRRPTERLPGLWLPLIALVGVLTAGFVAGLPNGYRSDTVHNFFKLLLALLATLAVASMARTGQFPISFLRVALVSGLLAGLVGLGLYAAPPQTSERFLGSLAVVGYPTERILRYVEDNPSLGLRATGTSVDPNSFGGMLALLVPLAAAQAMARSPRLPRTLALLALLAMASTLLLTRSRAAWIGAVVALAFLATVRYRRLWLPIVVGGLAVGMLGVGGEFLQRLLQGLALQDPATMMRLKEYSNALQIISRYPVLGIGFGPAPDPDLHPGVSSIYLTVAEQTGLLGLAAYLATVATALAVAVRAWISARGTENGDLALGLVAGSLAAFIIGLMDHYFMNPAFSHMAFMLWSFPALASGLISRLKEDDCEVVHPVRGAVEADPYP